jgi:hypothetical protein
MNQNSVVVKLCDLTDSDRPFGNSEGKLVFRKLSDYVDEHPHTQVFGVSFDGIEATDASFPRESVVALAKQLRGERGIYLIDVENRDLIDNWDYAAKAKDQPLVVWHDSGYEVIGPELSQSARTLLDYVLSKGSVLASQVATDLDMTVQNASTRLKNLVRDGFLLRTEEAADTGGIEFKYLAIR